MSSAIDSQPLPAARRRSASRVTTSIVAAVLGLAGLGIGGAGGVLLAAFDGGTIRSGSHRLSTPASAFASSVADISDLDDVSDVLGQPRVGVTARGSGQGVFVGVGRAEDVERYLAGTAVEEISDVEIKPFRLDRHMHEGARAPAPPATQRFWVASAAGASAASLRWDLHDGDYRVVLMNRDGSRGVDADVKVGLTIPHVPAIAWTLAGVGAALLVVALLTGVAGMRRREPKTH